MPKKKTKKTKSKAKKVSKVKKSKKVVAKKKTKNQKIVLPMTVEEIDIVEIDEEKKPDAYEEHACGFVNESECEEELEDDGLDLEDVEKDHFDKDDEE